VLFHLYFLFWIHSKLFCKLETLATALSALEHGKRIRIEAVSRLKMTLLLAGILILTFGIPLAKASAVEQFDYPVVAEGVEFHVIVETNSTISNFETFPEDNRISFEVNGTLDTSGFCNVTIPTNLLGGPYIVKFDGSIKWDKQETTNDTHVFLYITYTHSNHIVEITGTTWGPPIIAPVAIFSSSTTTPSVGDKVTFNASASYDPDGTLESWNWNFGDGTTDKGKIVDHTYIIAGNYTVTLKVTDNNGLNDIATTSIAVLAKPVHDVAITNITVSPTEVKTGETISINVVATNQGDFNETFEVTVYCNATEIKTESISNLPSGESKTLNINWETVDIVSNIYTIRAVASDVSGETETENNISFGLTVVITEKETVAIPIHYLVLILAITITLVVPIIVYFKKVRKTT
jgi:PKD repeat protein